MCAALGRGGLEAAAVRAVCRGLTDCAGDVLCFLPGAGEIRRVQSILEGSSAVPTGVQVLPLYGNLPPAQQDAAILADGLGEPTTYYYFCVW